MFDTGLPSSQVALGEVPAGRHGLGDRVAGPAGTSLNVLRVRRASGSRSSSSEKLAGDRPPPAVNEKSCGSSGTASLRHDDLPALAVREGAGDGLAGGDVDVRHRAAVVAGRGGLVPAAGHGLGERVAAPGHHVVERAACSTASRRRRRRARSSPGERPPPAVNEKSCGSFGDRVLDDHDLPALAVREGAGHRLAGATRRCSRPGCRRCRWRSSGPSRWARSRRPSSRRRARRSRTSGCSRASRRRRRRAGSSAGERPPPAVKEKSCGSLGSGVLDDHDLRRACGS